MAFEEGRLALPDGDVAYLRRAGRAGAGTVLFAHANGLNAGAYLPMLEALGGPESVLALDLRGHGRTTLPAEPEALTRWDLYGEDLGRVVRALAPEGPLVLAGHSLGAVAVLLAAAAGLAAERVVLIEPVVVPRLARLVARGPLRGPLIRRRGIAGRAARRRDGWPDEASARARYAEAAFFAGWHEGALDGYLARGLRPDGDGDGDGAGVRLACAPAWEAASFAAQGHAFWRPLGQVAARLPVHVLKARGTGSTVPEHAVTRLVRAGALTTQAEGSHMLPTERPAAVAAYLALVLSGASV